MENNTIDQNINPNKNDNIQNSNFEESGLNCKSSIQQESTVLSSKIIENHDIEMNKIKPNLNKSNLEILLSQNDIIPLLKKVNRESILKGRQVTLSEMVSKSKTGELNGELSKNLHHRRHSGNDMNPQEDEDDDFIKLETQPSNLQNGELKEYQLEAVNWLAQLHSMHVNGILADEMGLGKTIQTIGLIAYLLLKDANMTHLIIVPKVTIKNWEKEITKWLPNIKLLYFYGDKDERRTLENIIKKEKYNVILTTFECSMKEKTALSKIKYEYIIIDEAHRIKNDKAKFSLTVRQFESNHRLLLTGTPLQNNLHELWSLLNFLMPNIFNDSEEFDRIFNLDTADQDQQIKIVKQIHQLLRPFVLRRLKSEVEFKLPPKKEIYLYVGLSELQKDMYRKILSKNIDVVNGVSKDRIQLLNVLMQLKKVCNHPYLFPKVEEGPPYIDGEHIIYNSMKLKILDVLLKKIHLEGNKVLIFSQMVTLLNILDDYCRYRGFKYCRIDGQTSSEDRNNRIEDFQNPESDKWIFLISTRAGGLGINLHAANIVILYDSDWNPQVDLQAIDRAHRIGQTKPVTIYRFVCEGTVEEKIVERAAKKLKIDHLIIQKGKNIQNKISALEMTDILQYGVENIFGDDGLKDEKSIEQILEYSINKTELINNRLKSIEEKLKINSLSLNTSDKGNIYEFEGENYRKKIEERQLIKDRFITISNAMGQRERKMLRPDLSDTNKQKCLKPRNLTGWHALCGGGYLHQFYDRDSLDELDEKEEKWKEYLKKIENKAKECEDKDNLDKENEDMDEDLDIPERFTEKDEKRRQKLLSEGFKNWTKKDFSRFVHATEFYGLGDIDNISRMMKSKTPKEVSDYIKVFKNKYNELPNGDKIMLKINQFELEKNKIIEAQNILDEFTNQLINKFESENLIDEDNEKGKYENDNNILDYMELPYKETKFNKKKENPGIELFDKFEDKYLLFLLIKYGYRNWGPIKIHILLDPLNKFNINLKMKSEQELNDRANYLISCLKSKKKKDNIIKLNIEDNEKNRDKSKKHHSNNGKSKHKEKDILDSGKKHKPINRKKSLSENKNLGHKRKRNSSKKHGKK